MRVATGAQHTAFSCLTPPTLKSTSTSRRKVAPAFGIWSGFGVAIGFGALSIATAVFDLSPFRYVFLVLVGVKLATNTLAWLGLRSNRAVMPTQSLNTTADVVTLTIAMYYTGGAYSPLLPSYVILISVLSLLSNLGVTMLMAFGVVVSFATMIILMATGVLPPTPVLGSPGETPTVGYAIVAICYCMLVVGVPAAFSAATLRMGRR